MATYKLCMAVFSLLLVPFLALAGEPASAANSKPADALLKAVDAHADLDDKHKAFIKTVLVPVTNDPVFRKAVLEQNAKGVSLEKIQEMDKVWIAAEDEIPLHKETLEHPATKRIQELSAQHPAIGETFLMDNQGANVAQNALTSDYWQGDEDKWKESFNGGTGGLYVGKKEFDKSAEEWLRQIALPIFDEKGVAIGAICYGIRSDKLP
jgi:hypothetical protein